MIRGKRNDAYGRQRLRVDCCMWDSYCEAVSYLDLITVAFLIDFSSPMKIYFA